MLLCIAVFIIGFTVLYIYLLKFFNLFDSYHFEYDLEKPVQFGSEGFFWVGIDQESDTTYELVKFEDVHLCIYVGLFCLSDNTLFAKRIGKGYLVVLQVKLRVDDHA